MSSDPLGELERELLSAAHRQARITSMARPVRQPIGLAAAAVLALLALAAAALAASGLLSAGAPLKLPPGLPLDPHSGFGVAQLNTVRVLPIAVSDPGGGPPWGLRFVATTRGLGCLQAGRLVRGQIGVIGQDSAFANDGRFHPIAANYLDGPFACGALDAHRHAFGAVAMNGAPASGLIAPTRAQRGCTRSPGAPVGIAILPRVHRSPLPTCPAQDERHVYFGMAGPEAKSVTYLDGAKTRTVATVGDQGAYLIVLQAPPRGQQGFSPLPGAGGGPIRRIDYRNGYICRLHSPTSIRGTNTCPHVGQVPIIRPRLRPADVASPVTVRIARGPRGKTLIVSFTARVAVTGASSEYSISLRYPGSEPRCGSRISGALLRDVTSGRRQQFTEDTGGCRGTFRGTITYRYGQNTSGMPFDILGRTLTVGTFEVTVR